MDYLKLFYRSLAMATRRSTLKTWTIGWQRAFWSFCMLHIFIQNSESSILARVEALRFRYFSFFRKVYASFLTEEVVPTANCLLAKHGNSTSIISRAEALLSNLSNMVISPLSNWYIRTFTFRRLPSREISQGSIGSLTNTCIYIPCTS